MKFWFYAAGLSILVIILSLWPLLKSLIISPQMGSFPLKRAPLPSGNLLIALSVTALIPLSALLLYWRWGAYPQVQQAAFVQQRVAEVKAKISQTGSRQSLITEFEQHLQAKPENAKGWYLLGKLYLNDGRVKEAVKALETSDHLQPNNPETMTALAEALFRDHNNSLTPPARNLLLKVLKLQPDATLALNLLAIDVYNKGQYNQAVSYFEKLLPYYPPDTEEGKRLLAIIAEAQRLSQ